MGTWREVKSADELKDGQRIRYYDGKGWVTSRCYSGSDSDPRLWSTSQKCVVDPDGDACTGGFPYSWEHVEALFDDEVQATATKPSRPAATKPTYIATWDGIEYRDGHIGNRTLEQHAARIAEVRAELDKLHKQSRRYRAIEKRLK